MVGAEQYIPYQRPPLSKEYLSGEQEKGKLNLRQESFYSDKDINLILETEALSVDSQAKEVTLATGKILPYDKLLIATGGRPRKLEIDGSSLSVIHYLRTLSDVDLIR